MDRCEKSEFGRAMTLGGRRVGLVMAGVIGALSLLLTPRAGVAQASNYPSLQVPRASDRDYTAAIAGGNGSSLLFQWREGLTGARHLQLDVGATDRKGDENLLLFVAGTYAQQLTTARGDQPLDVLFTVGGGAGFSSGTTIFRFPVGTSLGHTFDLEDGLAITPYVHPRASLDACSNCGRRGGSRSELTLNFDVGVSFRVNRTLALRAAAAFSGSDLIGNDDALAFGLTWTPTALLRTALR